MAIPDDFSAANIPTTPATLDPAETLSQSDLSQIGQYLSGPSAEDTANKLQRPAVDLGNGSVGTVKSIGVGDERGEWVIPTIVNGRPLSSNEAIAMWRGGQNPPIGGPFKSVAEANNYAEAFHQAEAKRLGIAPDALSPEDLGQIGKYLSAPEQQGASIADMARYLSGRGQIDVGGPAPETPEGMRLMQERLAWEQENLPATRMTPEGQNPNIQYPQGPQGGFTTGNPVTETAARAGTAILQAGASLGRQATGALDMLRIPVGSLPDTYGAVQRGQAEVAHEEGGVPLVGPIVQNVATMAPALVLGSVGGLPALSAAFGLGAAGEAYETAKDANYAHPEVYGVLSGLIAAGTALIPGYKGPNLVAAGNQVIQSTTWKQYMGKLLQQYGSGKIWQTHGGSTALMMGVQSTLQGLLDQQTVNPNLTWKDIIFDTAQSMGLGAIIGEGFGALGQHATTSQHNQVMNHWMDEIQSSQLSGNTGYRADHFEAGTPPGPSLRMVPTAGIDSQGRRIQGQVLPPTLPPETTGDESSSYDVMQRNRGSLRLPQGVGTQPVSERVRAPQIPIEDTSAEVAARNQLPAPQGPSPIVTRAPEPNIEEENARIPQDLSDTGATDKQKRQWLRTLNNMGEQQPPPGMTADQWMLKLESMGPPPAGVTPDQWIEQLKQLPAAQPKPLAPTMDTARRIVNMTPQEFHANASSFNKINLAIGANATPADVVELQQLKDKAEQRLQEATIKAKQSGSDEDLRNMGILSSMPQFYNEAIAEAGKKAAPAPVAAVEPEPTLITGNQLPKKGERLNIGEFFITRNRQGNVVLRTEGDPHALATMKREHVDGLTQKAILADLTAKQRGEKTKYWEVASDRSGGLKEKVKEEVLSDENYKKDLISNLGDSAGEQALKAAIHADALTLDKAIGLVNELRKVSGSTVTKVVGKTLATKGPKALATALKQVIDQTTKKYLQGKLLERTIEGQSGKVPIELQKVEREVGDDGTVTETPTGKLKSEKEIRASFADEKALATRALYILMHNREIAADVHLNETKIDPGEHGDIRASSDVGSPTAIAPVTKTGFTDAEVETKFSDEDIKGKEAQAEQVDEIKSAVLGGDASRYDEGIGILTKTFGFSPAKAAQWMDSETTFMAPGQRRVAARNLTPEHYAQEQKLRGPFRLLGPEVVALRQLIPTNKQGTLNGDQTVAVLKAHLSPIELQIYTDAGLGRVLAGGVTPEDLAKWMQANGPRVEIHTAGQHKVAETQWVRDYADLSHWYDNLDGGSRQAIDRARVKLGGGNGAGMEHELSFLGTQNYPKAKYLLELEQRYRNEGSPESGHPHWQMVSPKDERSMAGYTEIAVTIPLNKGDFSRRNPNIDNVRDYEKAAGVKFPSSHQFPPNTLAWVRGYMETTASGKKVFHIIEVQSDWAQKQRGNEAEIERNNFQNPSHELTRLRDPLLRDYEKLAIKAAIDHALREGADSIAISDAETAMMTEGHDRGADYPIGVGGATEKTYIKEEGGMRLHYEPSVMLLDPEGNVVERFPTADDAAAYAKHNRLKVSTEDKDYKIVRGSLHEIAADLTGSKGERVSFGDHKRALHEAALEDPETGRLGALQRLPRPDLIFKNPDQTPKTDATAHTYDLSKVKAGERPNVDLLMGGKLPVVTDPLNSPNFPGEFERGVVRPATREDFTDTQHYELFKRLGLLSGNAADALSAIAATGNKAAKALIPFVKELAKVKLGNLGGETKAIASYNPDNNTIRISLDPTLNGDINAVEATLHEIGHALLVRRLRALPESHPLQVEIQSILDAAKVAYTGDDPVIKYALQNSDELLTMSQSNPETVRFLQSTPDTRTGGNLWDRFITWAKRLLFGTKPLGESLSRAFNELLSRPAVGNVDWLEQNAGTFNYPEIRRPSQFEEASNFAGEYLPEEEKAILTRKAIANNNWITAPDITAILDALPKDARGAVKATIDNRLAVLERVKSEPGADQPSTMQDILNDPHLNVDRKSEIARSALANVLHFKESVVKINALAQREAEGLIKNIERLDKGITESSAAITAADNVIDSMVSDFKDGVLRDKQKALDLDQIDMLNRQLAMADEMKGNRRSAFSKFINALSQRIDLDTLLSTEDPKLLAEHIREAFPANTEMVKELGVSEDTIQRASIIMARSNTLREELITLKLMHDTNTRRGVFDLNERVNEGIKAKNINQVIDQFSGKLRRTATRQERQAIMYRTLYAEKVKRLKNVAKLANASGAMNAILKTATFRNLDELLTNKTELLRPLKVNTDSKQIQYTHPLTREPVLVGYDYQKDGETANLQKLSDIVDAAKIYLAKPEGEHYSPPEAAFWRNEIANSAFLLDPALSYNARKLVGAKLDPYKLTNFTGSTLLIPEHVLRRIGGRAATDLITGLQALSVVDSQSGNLLREYNASISLAANDAAKAHKMPVDQWHEEVLNPMMASRQTTGYEPLTVGKTTLYGHEVLPQDEKAFQVQREFDQQLRKIALEGRGNPAVQANPAKITFVAPGGETMQRKALATGRDTMPRRLLYKVKDWATEWFNDSSVQARKDFMDARFNPVVMGHVMTVGAPDYTIKSTISELYKAARKTHRTDPITSVDELLNVMFDAQSDMAPESQLSKDAIMKRLIDELSVAFKNVSSYNPGRPSPDVGALISVVDTDNSFTQERGRLVAPSTFYNYGLTFDNERLGRVHSAKAYYTLNIGGANGLLDKLIASVNTQIQDFKNQIEQKTKGGLSAKEAVKEVQKVSMTQQQAGDLLLNYSESLDAQKKLNKFRTELTRILTNIGTTNDPDARQFAQTAQSFITANLLASVQSQNTNAFGGLANLMFADKMLLGRSATASIISSLGRFLGNAPIEIASAVAESHPKLAKALTSPLTGPIGDAIASRMLMHKEMEAYGLAPKTNVWGDLKAYRQMFAQGGRPQQSNPSFVQDLARRTESVLGTIAVPMSAVAPRLVDRYINELTVWKARDIEDMLRKNAARYGEARESLGLDWSKPAAFSISEMVGRKASDRQEALFRNVFTRTRMSIDDLMWRYYEKYKAASDKNSVEFFTPEERAAFQYSLATDINLPVFGNRPLFGKGSRGRNMLSLFFGFPAWQAAAISDYISRAATEKSSFKHLPTTIAAMTALAALGAISIKSTKMLKQFFYNERNDYPDITAANNVGDAVKALSVGFFTYLPFLGSIANNIIMDNGVRNGFDVNSQFVMLNFANDVMATVKRIWQTNDAVRPMEDFTRRWSPLARIAINRLDSQEGLTEYYNLQREARSLAPDGMELKKRGKPSFDATPVTPILQDLVNAAYRNDTEGFAAAENAYIKYQTDHGMSPDAAMQNLRSAWRSRHPFVSNFGRMPTAAEEAVIYENATPEQRKAIDNANEVFQSFGKLLGSNVQLLSKDEAATGGKPSGAPAAIVRAPTQARNLTTGTATIGSLVVPGGITGSAGAPAGVTGGSLVSGGSGGSLLSPSRGRGNARPVGATPFKGPARKGGPARGGRKGSLRVSQGSGMKVKIHVSPNISIRNPKGGSLRGSRGPRIGASKKRGKN